MSIYNIYLKSIANNKLTAQEAIELINISDAELPELLDRANEIREKFFGNQVMLCGIINAKSGKCSEDCSFCAQSARHQTNVDEYSLLSKDRILQAVEDAKANNTGCFSIVTSGKGYIANAREMESIIDVVKEISGVKKCASLGLISLQQAKKLKEAGLEKFHHNLETAESFFPNMCTTHTYKDRVETIRNAKMAGLKVCVGGIFGIGETREQMVELGMAISELEVDSVPINIVHQIDGTKLYGSTQKLEVNEILKLIATFRFIMPNKVIGVFGGRQSNLADRQREIFRAGANSILVGNYLTVKGNNAKDDILMLKELGLEPVSEFR
ncbi:MAG: biotin synthase BioB [Candidatus Margulisbacteria bacterium]|nr:biotin synthase BioB [Candidatus Margulisiibacteriota bacterium]